MAEGNTVLVGAFDASDRAKDAIHDLRDARFGADEIGVLVQDRDGEPELRSFRDLEGNKAATGAAIGAAAGAGGGALWALGVAAGFLPAIGPIVAGGLLTAVAATAAAGAGAGVVVGTLAGLGVTDEEAAYYEDELKSGRTIVVVKPKDRAALARTILTAHGARFREVVPGTLATQLAAAQR